MAIEEIRKIFIKCDCCGKSVQCTPFANNYGFYQIDTGTMIQDGSGMYKDYTIENSKLNHLCNQCYKSLVDYCTNLKNSISVAAYNEPTDHTLSETNPQHDLQPEIMRHFCTGEDVDIS